MDIALIETKAEIAKAAYKEYREGRTGEDREIARIYRYISRNKPVFDLNQIMAKAGLNEHGQPRLAMCRADARFCWLQRRSSGALNFCMDNRINERATMRYVHVPAGHLPADVMPNDSGWRLEWRTIVPIIPPHLRPTAKLLNYHILWEPTWERNPKAPHDPFLCKRLGSSLYAVLAAWDLTEVERSVIGLRQ